MNKLLAGTVSGLAATVPMTLAMIFIRRFMTAPESGRLPPHEVTTGLAKQAGMRHHLDRPEHFPYLAVPLRFRCDGRNRICGACKPDSFAACGKGRDLWPRSVPRKL